MSDPFRPEANQQLMREARIGLTLLAITLATFVYVAYHRISGNGKRLPEYVVNAPIAEAVWPGENPLPLVEKEQTPKTLGSQFGDLLASARDKFASDRETSPANKLHRQSRNFVDPTPSKNNTPIPGTSVPNREPVSKTALARIGGKATAPMEKNGFVPASSRGSRAKSPIDTTDLRSAKNVKIAATGKEKNLTKIANRLPQQASTLPVIVTPEKINDSDFAAVPLRPFNEANAPPTKPSGLASSENTTNELRSRSFAPDQSDVRVDNSFSHKGSQISSQVVTADIAANLAGQTSDPDTIQGQSEKQTSFDSEPGLPPDVVSNQKTVAESISFSPDPNSAAAPVIDGKTPNATEHLVMAGESFWSIAQQHYDDGRYFRALYQYNKRRVGSFENLVPGDSLATPPKTELIKLWPEYCPGANQSSPMPTSLRDRIYITNKGDTLFEIARQRLEQASRYLDIQNLNQIRLPEGVDHLTPLPEGIQLVLPLDRIQ